MAHRIDVTVDLGVVRELSRSEVAVQKYRDRHDNRETEHNEQDSPENLAAAGWRPV